MAAPTSVSGVAYSSTLVTPGDVLIRFSGTLTASFAGRVLLLISDSIIFIVEVGLTINVISAK